MSDGTKRRMTTADGREEIRAINDAADEVKGNSKRGQILQLEAPK